MITMKYDTTGIDHAAEDFSIEKPQCQRFLSALGTSGKLFLAVVGIIFVVFLWGIERWRH
jgi:hypothetical protein